MLKKLTVFILWSSGWTGNDEWGVGEIVLAGSHKLNGAPQNKKTKEIYIIGNVVHTHVQ